MEERVYKFKFKDYTDELFLGFVREIANLYKMKQMQCYPHRGKNIFNEFQLKHIAPNWDIKNSRGFMYAWMRHRDIVKSVTFDIFSPDKLSKMRITIHLDEKLFILEGISGISYDEIVPVLKRYFDIKDITFRVEIIWFSVMMVSVFVFIFWDNLKSGQSNIATESFRKMLAFFKHLDKEYIDIDKIFSNISWQMISIIVVLLIIILMYFFRQNIYNNLNVHKKENNQDKKILASSKFWWRDTPWGTIGITVFSGLIIAFLVYLFGWNK